MLGEHLPVLAEHEHEGTLEEGVAETVQNRETSQST